MRAFLLVTAALLFGGLVSSQTSGPWQNSANAAQTSGLESTLLNGLQARLPVDRAFIKKTVNYVRINKLTQKSVMEIFVYCRNKVSPQRRATIFRILMSRRAKAMGVNL